MAEGAPTEQIKADWLRLAETWIRIADEQGEPAEQPSGKSNRSANGVKYPDTFDSHAHRATKLVTVSHGNRDPREL